MRAVTASVTRTAGCAVARPCAGPLARFASLSYPFCRRPASRLRARSQRFISLFASFPTHCAISSSSSCHDNDDGAGSGAPGATGGDAGGSLDKGVLRSPLFETLRYGRLRELVQEALMRHGAETAVAAAVAEELCKAERDGCPEHGVSRLEIFCKMLQENVANGSVQPMVEETTEAILKADGGGGFSQPCVHMALPMLIDAAWENGFAVLTVSNCRGVTGALWSPLEMIASAGLVGVGLCNTPAYVAWPGSRKRILGTNPLAFSWPRRGRQPLVIDQASSLLSRGKLASLASMHNNNDGGTGNLPSGAAVDTSTGKVTSDPVAGLHGAMLPFGNHKGANIALMVELLSTLAGGGLAFETTINQKNCPEQPGKQESPENKDANGDNLYEELCSMDRGMIFLALCPEFFPGGVTAGARAELLFEHIKSGEGRIQDVELNSDASTMDDEADSEKTEDGARSNGSDRDSSDYVHSIPRLPGDKRYDARKEVESTGMIRIQTSSYRKLAELAAACGLENE